MELEENEIKIVTPKSHQVDLKEEVKEDSEEMISTSDDKDNIKEEFLKSKINLYN